jgi:hypothetical protein
MSCAKVLAAMDADRPLFSNTSSDPVCAFDFLRPHTSNPNSPVFELIYLRFITAMMNSYTIGVTEQDDRSFLADDGVQAINFFLGMLNEVF